MSWEVRQTRRFARVYKRLSKKATADLDAAVVQVASDPDIGVKKKGDISQLWVYSFRSAGQLYLLGYTREDYLRLVYLENIGPHEHFYRDIKRNMK